MMTNLQLWAVFAAAPLALFALAQARAWPRADADGALIQDRARCDSDSMLMSALAALACFAAVLRAQTALGALGALAFSAILVHLAVVDWRCFKVPVRSTLALGALGVAFLGVCEGVTAAVAGTLTALAAWGVLRGVDHIYKAARGRSGLGAGDALAAGALAPWLAAEHLAWALALAGLSTLAVLAWRAKHSAGALNAPAPFVPGLALSAYVIAMGAGF